MATKRKVANTSKPKAKAKAKGPAVKPTKAAPKAKAPAKNDPASPLPPFIGIREGTKAEMLLGMVTAKGGATKPAMLKALGNWKGCGNYLRIACDRAGLKLERKKVDGVTRWFAS